MSQTGNGLQISAVQPANMTFQARIDAPSFDDPGVVDCTYEEDGDFACAPVVTSYNFSDFGMSGTATKSVEYSGLFVERIRVINGAEHTFSPAYSLRADVDVEYTCAASTQDCATAAMQGFNVTALPCRSEFTEPATNLSDPSLPSR